MALLTSHVLDAVNGCPAAGIRVEIRRIETDGLTTILFDGACDNEGRLSEQIAVDDRVAQFELIVHAADYFRTAKVDVMPEVVVRFQLQRGNDQRQHIPVVLSPHSYTVWWSEPR